MLQEQNLSNPDFSELKTYNKAPLKEK